MHVWLEFDMWNTPIQMPDIRGSSKNLGMIKHVFQRFVKQSEKTDLVNVLNQNVLCIFPLISI